MNSEWTFFLLKPDAIKRELISPILGRVTSHGLCITYEGNVLLQRKHIFALYGDFTFSVLPGQYEDVVRELYISYLTEGPCLYVEVSSDEQCQKSVNIFHLARTLQGRDFYPERCLPGSIRFDFRDKQFDGRWKIIDTIPGFGDVAGQIVYNLIHTPSGPPERDHQARLYRMICSPDI